MAFGCAHHQEIKDGHAHGNAIGNLLKDGGLWAVGNFGSDFGAAIDGAGVKNEGVFLGQAHAFGIELVKQDVVTLREGRFVQAFGLHAQNDDDVSVFESFFNAIDTTNGRARRANVFQFARNPHSRAAEGELAAKFAKQVNVGTGDARVSDVSQDGDIQIVQRAFAVANGQSVQETLRRMLMRAISGIDHGNFQMAGDKIRRSGGGVSHDETIRFHGVQIVCRVEKRFALFEAGSFGLQVHGVGAKARGGGAETQTSARGIFKKGKSYGFAAESGEFLERMLLNFLEWFCLIEKKGEFIRRERLKR